MTDYMILWVGAATVLYMITVLAAVAIYNIVCFVWRYYKGGKNHERENTY